MKKQKHFVALMLEDTVKKELLKDKNKDKIYKYRSISDFVAQLLLTYSMDK